MSRKTTTARVSKTEHKNCAWCKAMFSRPIVYSRAYWARQKFCGQDCFGKDRTAKADAIRPTMHEVFSKWFDKTDGCWLWEGARDKNGYGAFNYGGTMYKAHRVSVELSGRLIPKGHCVCHHCDTPACVNPGHLYVGTYKQNAADAINRNRVCRGANSPSAKLTKEDIIAIRKASGTHETIAREYNICAANVGMIKNRLTWKHIP